MGNEFGYYGLYVIAFLYLAALIHGHLAKEGKSYKEYIAQDGALTDRGNVRCVYCGYGRMYIHGKYKSDAKFHDCAKCGRNLYVTY
ncbi:MAG: hypothetical protein AB1400_11065 [Pseudomonadota bacterium]